MKVIVIRRCEAFGLSFAPAPRAQDIEDDIADELIAQGHARPLVEPADTEDDRPVN